MAERAKLKVGFIPIIDCAPVVLAEELGAFERQGLDVEIRREVSWANVRDKLTLGLLDASHILAPLPLALTLGIDSVNVPLVNVMTLQLNGIALTGPDIWKGMPEKVLGTTESFAANNPETLRALIKALLEACQWLDEPSNRSEAARLLSSPRYLNTPAEVMSRTLDLPDFHVFYRQHANFPWRSHADWFLAQMVRWGQVSPGIDIKA